MDDRKSLLRWSYLSTFSTAGLQLVAAATITRFLRPQDYGLAAMAMLCSGLAGYFTQLGMDRALIQAPRLTDGNIRAAFTLSLSTGLVGCVALCGLSPLLARYFRQPRLAPVIVAFAFNLVFQSFSMIAGGLLRREFRIRQLAICDILAYLLSTFGLGLPMAITGHGVWALVISNVSQPLFAAIGYYIARPHPVLPTFVKANYHHITGFGGKVSATTLVEAMSGYADTIVLGRMVSASALGIYNRSMTLSTQPIYALSAGLSRVFHPSIARAAERTLGECRLMLQNSERQLMAVIIPVCAGAAAAAPTLVPAVFGKQWSGSVHVYQVLCIAAALDATFHLPTIQLEVLCLFRKKFLVQVLYGGLLAASAALAAPHGIFAVACVLSALQLIRTLFLHILSARSLETGLWSLLRVWCPGGLCGVAVGAVIFIAQSGMSRAGLSSQPLRALLLIVASSITAVLLYRTFYRDSVYVPWLRVFHQPSGPTVHLSEEIVVA